MKAVTQNHKKLKSLHLTILKKLFTSKHKEHYLCIGVVVDVWNHKVYVKSSRNFRMAEIIDAKCILFCISSFALNAPIKGEMFTQTSIFMHI